MRKRILSGAFRLGSIWCNFSRDSKRHLSYPRLSPCQISHPSSKAWRRASFLANYLQALITWPKQFILPHLIFWGSQIFLFELSKAKGISCGQTHDMEIFSSNSLSLAKLQTIDSSPGRGSARRAQRQAGLPAPPVAWPWGTALHPLPGGYFWGPRSSDLWCIVCRSLTVQKLQARKTKPYNRGAWQQRAMDQPWLLHQTWRTCPLLTDLEPALDFQVAPTAIQSLYVTYMISSIKRKWKFLKLKNNKSRQKANKEIEAQQHKTEQQLGRHNTFP